MSPPICDTLGWNVSTYYAAKARPPADRALPDDWLADEIRRVYEDNYRVYGARKVWIQLGREGIDVARCTVAADARPRAARRASRRRAQAHHKPDSKAAAALPDLVGRQFTADRPDQTWVADLTYVSTWAGFVYTALITDVFSRLIVGWALGSSLHTNLPLAALEMAPWRREPAALDGLVHHSDRGCQYTAMRYTDRLTLARITASVGSVGDSYDNALAESTIGLYKTELIDPCGPWRTRAAVELATLEWVQWFNHHGCTAPAVTSHQPSTRRPTGLPTPLPNHTAGIQ